MHLVVKYFFLLMIFLIIYRKREFKKHYVTFPVFIFHDSWYRKYIIINKNSLQKTHPITIGQNFFNLPCPLDAMVTTTTTCCITCNTPFRTILSDELFRFLVLTHRSVRYLARRVKIKRSSIKQEDARARVTSVGWNTQNAEIAHHF